MQPTQNSELSIKAKTKPERFKENTHTHTVSYGPVLNQDPKE